MFCTKCGKTIDDNAPFCGFCGAPTGVASDAAPQQAPQPAAPQNNVPQYGAPQQGMYQQSQPQYGASNPNGAVLNLSQNNINWIKLGLLGVIAILSLLVLIASISVLSTTGSAYSGNFLVALKLPGLITFARVSAILCFSFSVLGVVFTVLVKQPWKLLYVCAGISVVMFVFNFVLGGWMNAMSIAPIIVSGIFLILCASSMLSLIVRTVLKDFIGMFKK